MSIYISGVDMPKGCGAVTLKVWPDGEVEIIDEDGEWKTTKAVPVPPHGRLGDLDALFNTMLEERDRIADSYGKNDEYVRCLEKYSMSMVSSAPTIIPAEPPKEEQI